MFNVEVKLHLHVKGRIWEQDARFGVFAVADVFSGLLGWGFASLGDFYPMFGDSVVVPNSRIVLHMKKEESSTGISTTADKTATFVRKVWHQMPTDAKPHPRRPDAP